jgi:hypothetical protein
VPCRAAGVSGPINQAAPFKVVPAAIPKMFDPTTIALRATMITGQRHIDDPRLTRVVCACRPGLEGTQNCNFGRLCGSLSIGGRDVGSILIGEGLAHPYVCGTTSCPQRRPWC